MKLLISIAFLSSVLALAGSPIQAQSERHPISNATEPTSILQVSGSAKDSKSEDTYAGISINFEESDTVRTFGQLRLSIGPLKAAYQRKDERDFAQGIDTLKIQELRQSAATLGINIEDLSIDGDLAQLLLTQIEKRERTREVNTSIAVDADESTDGVQNFLTFFYRAPTFFSITLSQSIAGDYDLVLVDDSGTFEDRVESDTQVLDISLFTGHQSNWYFNLWISQYDESGEGEKLTQYRENTDYNGVRIGYNFSNVNRAGISIYRKTRILNIKNITYDSNGYGYGVDLRIGDLSFGYNRDQFEIETLRIYAGFSLINTSITQSDTISLSWNF